MRRRRMKMGRRHSRKLFKKSARRGIGGRVRKHSMRGGIRL